MLKPDVRWMLNDREVGGRQAFTVRRRRMLRERGHAREMTEDIGVTGNVQPGSFGMSGDTPEDRQNETIVIRAAFAFRTGEQDGTGSTETDEVIYNGKRYRVTNVENWEEWGFTTAYAVRVRAGIGG